MHKASCIDSLNRRLYVIHAPPTTVSIGVHINKVEANPEWNAKRKIKARKAIRIDVCRCFIIDFISILSYKPPIFPNIIIHGPRPRRPPLRLQMQTPHTAAATRRHSACGPRAAQTRPSGSARRLAAAMYLYLCH